METNIGRLRREKPPKGACGSATGGRERHDYRRIRAKIAFCISLRGALYWRAYPETEHERLPAASRIVVYQGHRRRIAGTLAR